MKKGFAICSMLVIVLLLVQSCKIKKENERIIPVIDFGIDRTVCDHKLSDFADSVSYIELESTTESYLGEISDIKFTNDRILVFDQKLQKVLLFTSNGKFLKQIGKKGKGPGEYPRAFTVGISQQDNSIFVYSVGDKMLKYSESGIFINSISTKDKKILHFTTIDEEFVYAIAFPLTEFCGKYSLGIMDAFGKTTHSFLNRKQTNSSNPRSMICNTSFYCLHDSIYYWEYIYDTIYCLTNEKIVIPKWILDYGDNFVSKSAFSNIGVLNDEKRSGKLIVTRLIESRRYLFFIVLEDIRRKLVIYDKESEALTELPPRDDIFYGIDNNIDKGPAFWPKYIVNDSIFACVIAPENLIKLRNHSKTHDEFENLQFQKILENVTLRSNHIIMKTHLK
ncbi:MAG: 6-bladed beta-propeller [Bacteroidota bacterium]|nr:6-bladed beta-propeller [Bacteroidota bacterium]